MEDDTIRKANIPRSQLSYGSDADYGRSGG
ncbi:uncharacterized protein G2W53_019871 [Senna tora]|uniref:Uncharacterized protein n=1 Tax=Senna tora TaxID=362788 RepID=A0A834TUU8_9FABA|nr:uncharacterized protein G2W53_019871 [Senna tora]